MSAPTVTHTLNLVEPRWKQFSITTSTTAQRMVPLALSVTAITRSGRVVTVETAAAHNYFAGQYVWIAGATQDAYNGKRLVATVVDATHFTYQIPGRGPNYIEDGALPVTPATGTITVYERHFARKVRLRTGVNGSDTVGIGPNSSADWYEIPASTEYSLPDMPDDAYMDLSQWWVQGSANTPTVRILYC